MTVAVFPINYERIDSGSVVMTVGGYKESIINEEIRVQSL